MPRPLLLTIPFSHYCERARWALDYARVDYVEEGHVPLFHRIAVSRAGSPNKSVPVLLADGRTLGDSTEILAWADAKAPAGRELYPRDEVDRREVLALEEHLDEELGPHIRRVLYYYLLPRPKLVFALIDQRTPKWQRFALRAGFPLLFEGMRRYMKIDARSAEESLDRVWLVMDGVEQRLAGGKRYLVGDRFTAADLTLAALAGPAVSPPEHGIRFPATDALPAPAQALLRDVRARPIAEYVRRVYREHRAS